MGARFQVHVIGKGMFYDNDDNKIKKDYMLSYYMQWCWGQYSIIRAYQLLEFLNEYQYQRYNKLNENSPIKNYGSSIIPTKELNNNIKFDKLEKILSANIEINRLIHSFTEADLVMKKYLDDLRETDTFYHFDNNSGCLLIDTRKKGDLKYCFLTFTNPMYYNDELYEKVERGEIKRSDIPWKIKIHNAYEYFKDNGNCIFKEAFKEAKNENERKEAVYLRKKFNYQLKFLKKFNLMTKEEIISIYPSVKKDTFIRNKIE